MGHRALRLQNQSIRLSSPEPRKELSALGGRWRRVPQLVLVHFRLAGRQVHLVTFDEAPFASAGHDRVDLVADQEEEEDWHGDVAKDEISDSPVASSEYGEGIGLSSVSGPLSEVTQG